ncbi:hypothetical protein AXF42_Ash012948 [Apostasia shenzhenica]|uniref:Uncharacterized protein n=1 Tax=Apostasia shenzhenica TaxID=1088818 RepID=A0A2I0ARP5_9ASPA|nr:hypothetical protein AXF42_Ash012948 [Apostasia shenzhenica]
MAWPNYTVHLAPAWPSQTVQPGHIDGVIKQFDRLLHPLANCHPKQERTADSKTRQTRPNFTSENSRQILLHNLQHQLPKIYNSTMDLIESGEEDPKLIQSSRTKLQQFCIQKPKNRN